LRHRITLSREDLYKSIQRIGLFRENLYTISPSREDLYKSIQRIIRSRKHLYTISPSREDLYKSIQRISLFRVNTCIDLSIETKSYLSAQTLI
jgi:vacuolar-type H+-ATPase subunit D/Vma8